MKSTQKKILLLRSTGSEFFDEAYFVLKEHPRTHRWESDSEMIREANRIVNENMISGYFRREGIHTGERAVRLRLFAAGVASGILCALLFFIASR